MAHFDLKIFGRVQGINFRWDTKRQAKRGHIFGYVQNMPDGSVWIEAEGESQDLKTFVEWCNVGPPYAKVSKIEVVKAESKHYNDFEIRY